MLIVLVALTLAGAAGFYTAQNFEINTDINTQEGDDSSGNPEPLYGSSTLSLIQSQLQGALLGGSASGKVVRASRRSLPANRRLASSQASQIPRASETTVARDATSRLSQSGNQSIGIEALS